MAPYLLIPPGKGRVVKRSDFTCKNFAATDCVDDVGIFIPLGTEYVFVGNMRASTRPDSPNEIIKLKDSLDVLSGLQKSWNKKTEVEVAHTKYICTAEQGVKLKEVVKTKLRKTIKAQVDHFPTGPDLDQLRVRYCSAIACFRPPRPSSSVNIAATSTYIAEAMCELLQRDLNYAPCHGFVTSPEQPHLMLSNTGVDGESPHAVLASYGYDRAIDLPIDPDESKSDLNFIWHEGKRQWMTRFEYQKALKHNHK